jgi:hypothetical protein
MVDMFLADVFDNKVIHDKCETDRAPLVFPVAQCDLGLGVASLAEAFFK